jgi:signal transduction histidine kinase/FixJ family two-component response regulator/anti-sigma regulatory factor (Ser/Thr protein kinase)
VSGHRRRNWRSEPLNLPPDLAAAVESGGEMGRLFAEFDWANHPLGTPAQWPAEMRTTVATTLASRFPINLWLSPDDLFTMYNEAYIPILGNRHPAALGMRGEGVWWDIWDSIGPLIESVFTSGKAVWVDDLLLPVITGGRRQERYFTFSYGPLIGDSGAVYGVVATVAETTERVLGERRLHLLNAVASATMETHTVDDAVGAAVSVCADQPDDVPFLAAYVRGADAADTTLRGATPSVLPLLPPTLEKLTHWEPAARSRAEVQIIENVSSVIRGLHMVLGADCPDQALVLPLGENAIAGALVVGTNSRCPLDEQYLAFCQLLADQLSSALASVVSHEQQRQRADALAELDRAKTAFLTNVSHEFRTPLTLLLGPLEDALADVGSHTVLAERLRMARRNAGRLLRLVDSLLQFSRVEAGRATTKLVCTDVGALTSQIASSFTELCERAGLELVLDCHRALADVDQDMWETIMLNVISNAVKYTLSGSITVSVHSGDNPPGDDAGHAGAREGRAGRPGRVLVSVRDTGVGISEADLKRLGERFFRADTARGRSVEGTGIGLSLVRGLVELQQGGMQIASELDRGTTVAITLPKSLAATPIDHALADLLDNPYVVEADQWVEPLPIEAAPAEDDRKLVLIADDNADMRAHIDRVLSVHWRTVLVADGEAALRATYELRPDAIVTDVMMPKLDGFDFVAAIRRDTELAATPIVMLSARAGNEAVSEGYAGGADDYLPKPFRSRELIERVAARLSAAGRERAGQQQREAELRHTSATAQLDAALQAADSVAGIADALLASPVGSGGAPIVVIGLLDVEENNVRFEYAGPVPAEFRDRYHVATLDTPLVPIDVIKTGQRMVIADTLALAPRYGHVVHETAHNVRSCVSQPLRGHDGKVIGSLGLLWPTPQDFDASELEMYARIAEITQSAVSRVRSAQREHRIAVDFQEHLLDLDRGSTAAVVAAVYQPGGEAMRVGGDWYLVAPLQQPGQIAVSVGDVVGHGLPAAIVMSRLRAAVSATALTGADPGAVLSSLDRYAAAVPGARCATVSYAVIDTGQPATADGTSSLTYSCAGHPYPLLVTPDHAPVFLQAGRRPPVAAWESHRKANTAEHDLPAGSMLLLYTDGLIERPGETLDEGFARLQAAAAYRAELSVGEFCDELLDRMAPPDGYTDDVVLLAVRPSHTTARSFATVLPAAPVNIPEARHRLRDWLTGIALDPRRQADILLATGEAVTNAVEHGSGGDSLRTVSIEAFLRGHTVSATISDTGRWSGDSSASQRSLQGGRGLTMINGLADHVKTVRTAHGTRITLDFHHAVVPGANLVEGVRR